MDAFEQIRSRAALLHEKAISLGADPFEPTSVVEAVVRNLDIEVIWLEPSDVALKGAKALFDDQSGTICCSKAGSAAERALLLAHEIGHVDLHDASSICLEDDIDPSSSIEPAPVGLQRVEDYGARERRELQANVFARELLLPRHLAKQLYIEKAMSASDIATRIGLSKALVRQQLLDAILLPSPPLIVAEHSTKEIQGIPDPSQERAARYRGTAFQLEAGPGTGKTRTLVKRVLSLLAEGVDPAAILVLTFSNRAAGELADRFSAAAPAAASRIWTGTFHAFGLDLIRRHYDRFGLSPNPVLFDRSDAIEVLQEILPTLPLVHYRNLWDPSMALRDIVVAISRAKDEVADPKQYRALAQEMLDRATCEETRTSAEKSLEIAQVYDLYESELRARDAVDFGDLILRPTLLLESDAALRVALQLRHRHVLVDEFQDVNRASSRLLRAISEDGNRLWVVGDSRQSIYRFRGASSANMSAFESEYADTAVDRLEINYRSTEQITQTIVEVSSRLDASVAMLPLSLASARGSGPGPPEIRRCQTPEDEIAAVAACIRGLERAGVRLRDQAVLCRSNARLNDIAVGLEARGIPVLHLGSLFERNEIRDLLALLTLSVDRFGDGLARVGAMPRYNLSLQDVYIATRRIRECEGLALRELDDVARLPSLSATGAAGIAQLAKDLHGLSGLSPWDYLCEYLLDRTDYGRLLAMCEELHERMRAVAIWQFLNFVREYIPTGVGSPIFRVLDRIRQLVLLAEERDLRQMPRGALHLDAVRLMTVHGSKGLEFEAVHIPSLNVSSFPASYRGLRCPPPLGLIDDLEGLSVDDEARRAHDNEEQCLFFVAISRARTHLRLYLSTLQTNGKKRSPSPYLGWLPSDLHVEIAQPETLSLPSDVIQLERIAVKRPATWKISDSHLALYKRCPRRYFYTHILGFRSGRKATAFSRTHDCLRDLAKWLGDARKEGAPTLESAEAAFEEIWQSRGPAKHAFEVEYRKIASRIIEVLVKSGADRQFLRIEEVPIEFGHGRVVVEPNEAYRKTNGVTVLRRINTARKRADEYDRLEYTLYHLAGEAIAPGRFEVEAGHLADDSLETVSLTAKKIENRRAEADGLLARMLAGEFPAEVDSVTCPRCPHFFICAAAPSGALIIE
jgi:superfamily I DNA/RNA helicase/Zn-dependent peptidase ImmA (M78 family)